MLSVSNVTDHGARNGSTGVPTYPRDVNVFPLSRFRCRHRYFRSEDEYNAQPQNAQINFNIEFRCESRDSTHHVI